MMVAMASKTGKVGFVGGMDIPLIRKFEAGYRAGVRDRTNEGPGTQDSMICKKVGPVFVPVGWNGADALFSNGFE